MKNLADATEIAAKLLGNGFRYRFLRMVGRPGKPQAVSLEITHSCVCRCLMCNIWRVPDSVPDLPLENWISLLSEGLLRDLRELDITGGEPFLRDDLTSLVRAVCELKRTDLRRLKAVAITTNGVLTDRVLSMVEEMLEPSRASGLELVVVCALDAVGDLHDHIRRHEGAWRKVDRTIAGLVELRRGHPNLIVGVKTTVLPQNIDELGRIAGYARERGLFTIISPAIVTAGRYLNAEGAEDLALSAAGKAKLAGFYKGPDFKWSYHAKMVAHYLGNGRVEKPCSCGFNYFFVRSSGEVFLCPLFEESAGNIEAAPIDRLFTSEEAGRIRERVGRSPGCARCTEPGLERYSLPYEGFAYLRALLGMGPRSFLTLHRHLGLDKYV